MIALIIFVAAYALIITEKVHRTIVGIVGAMLMVLCGIIDQPTAIEHNFNTLGLLMGMMIIVNITGETGLFNFLAIRSAKIVRAEPIKLLVALSILTAICSALLDNVTTVLLTVPITFSITQQLKVDVKPFLIAQILSANIGGTATLIGDPPNMMIASAVGLSFMDFVMNLAAPTVVIFIITISLLIAICHSKLHTQPELRDKVMRISSRSKITDQKLLIKCLVALALTFGLFFVHNRLGLETATAALTGAGFLLLLTARNDGAMIAKTLNRIEWTVIFFFAGLYVLVGALVETGVIKILAARLMELTCGSVGLTAILILWLSALASAFIDNIPFVATLIPLIKDMGAMGLSNLEPMWWSLALGACLGGNGTLIGASANVVVASIAAQKNRPITFIEFMKIAFPMMLLSIVIATAYVYWRYL